MITGIVRRFTHSPDDTWNADTELQPEVEEESELELPTDRAVLLAATEITKESASNDVDMKEYYKNLVQTAIQHDGKYQGQQMSVPWLRMILAGLESKPFAPEMMWQGEETTGPTDLSRRFHPTRTFFHPREWRRQRLADDNPLTRTSI